MGGGSRLGVERVMVKVCEKHATHHSTSERPDFTSAWRTACRVP